MIVSLNVEIESRIEYIGTSIFLKATKREFYLFILMAGLTRGFYSSAYALARTKYTKPKPKPKPRTNVRLPTQRTHFAKDLEVTAPVPPLASNLKCPDDHPLWSFFWNKKFMREPSDLDQNSRSWSIPELRRKSFEDLHSLWYICLKERNVLARENHLWRNGMEGQKEIFDSVDEKIRTTMWRIRHVLSERDWAYKLAKEESSKYEAQIVKNFETEFLEGPETADVEMFEMLSRFQYAMFGISEFVNENKVDRKFVDGMKYVASLKLKKFAPRDTDIRTILETSENSIKDAGEAFVIFTSENTVDAVREACLAVKELRETGNNISRYEEVVTVAEYVKKLLEAEATSRKLIDGSYKLT